MASAGRPARRALAWLGRACAVTAVAATVAGCVNMPDSGPTGAITASPQSTAAGGDFFEPFAVGPTLNESPKGIVNGFLAASASLPVSASIAKQYLLGSAARTWNPKWSVTVFSKLIVADAVMKEGPSRHGSEQAVVNAYGNVQAAFDGTGQFVSAQAKVGKTKGWPFQLAKVGGQWRIADPPGFRLLTAGQFTDFYNARDLYFVNPYIPASATDQTLVPAAVFVPHGTSTADTAAKLVNALLPDATVQPKSLPDGAGQPKSSWLQNAAGTFPAGTTIGSVTLDGTTAVVSLNGPVASQAMLEQVSAQLTWTLVTPRPGPPPAVQSVELKWNGEVFIPPSSICGSNQPRSPVQNQASYPCYDPYPSQPSAFSFTYHGQVWSRCTSEKSAQHGQVGPVVPVFRRASTASPQPCGPSTVDFRSTTAPAPALLPAKDGTPSIVAVSPDGDYVAYYAPDKKAVFIGPSATGSSSAAGTLHVVQAGAGSGVTALSWDRSDDLWIVQSGEVYVAPASGTAIQVTTTLAGVTALSIAPDGVRVAVVGQVGSDTEIQLGALVRSVQPSQGQRGSTSPAVSISNPVQVGPDLLLPDALTWYDADDLIVLAGTSDKTLSEVSVDGQNSFNTQYAPVDATSITADGSANALVAGLTGNGLDFSTGLEGPWLSLGVRGQNPAYPG